mmetsp:Transcript_26454/g.62568  ORF Transcript_26454/g.62568 Transcript_26454/m.62568 type:complete len:207 (+) Transcript_26454:731-1351(+)
MEQQVHPRLGAEQAAWNGDRRHPQRGGHSVVGRQACRLQADLQLHLRARRDPLSRRRLRDRGSVCRLRCCQQHCLLPQLGVSRESCGASGAVPGQQRPHRNLLGPCRLPGLLSLRRSRHLFAHRGGSAGPAGRRRCGDERDQVEHARHSLSAPGRQHPLSHPRRAPLGVPAGDSAAVSSDRVLLLRGPRPLHHRRHALPGAAVCLP